MPGWSRVNDLAGRGARSGIVLTPRRPTAAAASTCPHKTAPIAPRIPAPNIYFSTLCKVMRLALLCSRKLCETVAGPGLDSWVGPFLFSNNATVQLVAAGLITGRRSCRDKDG